MLLAVTVQSLISSCRVPSGWGGLRHHPVWTKARGWARCNPGEPHVSGAVVWKGQTPASPRELSLPGPFLLGDLEHDSLQPEP